MHVRTVNLLSSLQVGRAIASVLLVLYHTSYCVFDAPKYFSHDPFGNTFLFGISAFYYFFVLTGFTILHNYASDLDRAAQIWSYAWHRFVRVYPSYWVVLSLLLITYFAFPQLGQGPERQLRTIVSSLTLTSYGPMRDPQRPETIMLGVWALYHGILFYTLFGVMILSVRIGRPLMWLWFLASALMLFYDLKDASLLSFYFAPLHLLFGMGMGAAVLFRRGRLAYPHLVALVGIALFCVAAVDQLYLELVGSIPRSLIYGAGSTAAILGFAVWESNKCLRVPASLKFLGDASYSIFLVHYPILILLAKITSFLPWRESLPVAAWYVAFVTVAVSGSVFFYVFVEQPILTRMVVGRAVRAPSRGTYGDTV